MSPSNNTRSNSLKKTSNKQKKKQALGNGGSSSSKRVAKTARRLLVGPAPVTSSSSPSAEHLMSTTTASESTIDTSPLFFFRERVPETGWLSQWYPSVFTDGDGVVYKTAEHYMMYQKALLFNDTVTAAEILAAETPREVKALGRAVTPFSVPLWDTHRTRIVREGTYLKFTSCHATIPQNSGEEPISNGDSASSGERTVSLRTLLLGTGRRELVEASPFDRVWGIGCAAAVAPRRRQHWGMNLLGKVIMEVRGLLEQEEEGEKGEREGREG
ncbi:protein T24A6.7 [Cercophora scortea]|uniref:Protein T24A6.7 n=1 Tax=Cercophora scortea TaxID=314031 RepID=A0AAE0MKR8_9PEZI|nr:protein T24A6.7 [Cercophora scortea]